MKLHVVLHADAFLWVDVAEALLCSSRGSCHPGTLGMSFHLVFKELHSVSPQLSEVW